MENIIGITNARNNIKEIIDSIIDTNETFIVTRDTNPEAVIISYKDYLGYKELLKKISELQQDKAFEKSQEQFKKWLKEKGLNIENISDKDISWIIRTLEINK